MDIDLSVKNYSQKMGNLLTVKPLRMDLNLTSIVGSGERTHPLYLGHNLNPYREIIVHLPEGYSVDFLPKDIMLENEVALLKVKYQDSSGLVKVILDLRTKKHIILLEEYQQLRELFNKAVEATQQHILIKKKSE